MGPGGPGDWGIAYDASSTHQPFADTGVLMIQAGVPARHTDRAAEYAHWMLDDLASGGVSADEFERARQRAIGRLCVEQDDSYARAWQQLELILFGPGSQDGPADPWDTIHRLASVRHADVSALAEGLASHPRVTCIVDPLAAN